MTVSQMKILLIEDNEFNRDMLSRRLEKKGFEVIHAEDGKRGIELSIEYSPDLILMDMSLPVIDGWEATRAIKQEQNTQNIPIIGLSAHALDEDKKRAIDCGCDDYDTKPVDFKRLLRKISALLGI